MHEGIEYIGVQAFNHCRNLQSFTAPSTLKILGYDTDAVRSTTSTGGSSTVYYTQAHFGCFLDCKSLSSVTLNEGLEKIGNDAFKGCSSLTGFTIPSTVTKMYGLVLNGCSSLEYIISLPTTPPIIYYYNESSQAIDPTWIFAGTNDCPIYVPNDSLDAYKSADVWKEYKTRIKPISEFNQ